MGQFSVTIYEATGSVLSDNQHNDECITRFCHFLISDFGAPLRVDGLCWLAEVFKEGNPSGLWRREKTGDALVELAHSVLSSEAHVLSQNVQVRQALIVITAALSGESIPNALVLHERIKLLR